MGEGGGRLSREWSGRWEDEDVSCVSAKEDVVDALMTSKWERLAGVWERGSGPTFERRSHGDLHNSTTNQPMGASVIARSVVFTASGPASCCSALP